MANISTAEGSIALHGPVRSVHAFLHFRDKMASWNYSLNVDEDSQVSDDLELIIDENPEEEVSIDIDFLGFGRWHFSNNVQHLLSWLNHDRENPKSNGVLSGWTDKDEMAWNQLNNEPIFMTFSYVDVEEGVGFLVKEIAELEWDPGKILEPKFSENTIGNYDLTAENIHDLLDNPEAYDYSSYTVKDLDENEQIDWEWYVTEYVDSNLDTSILKNNDDVRYENFVLKLAHQLEQYQRDEDTNAIWYSVEEWFQDENIQEIIKNILK